MEENYIHELKKNIYKVICEQINADLTNGREDNGYQPYTQEMIDEFIEHNKEGIKTVVQNMFNVYEEDGILDELENLPHEYVREFLYDIVDVPLTDD